MEFPLKQLPSPSWCLYPCCCRTPFSLFVLHVILCPCWHELLPSPCMMPYALTVAVTPFSLLQDSLPRCLFLKCPLSPIVSDCISLHVPYNIHNALHCGWLPSYCCTLSTSTTIWPLPSHFLSSFSRVG